jgi:peptidyl-prolyl cis-trans isomerase SurA
MAKASSFCRKITKIAGLWLCAINSKHPNMLIFQKDKIGKLGQIALIALILNACTASQSSKTKEPAIAKVGNSAIKVSEFKYLYEKSVINKDSLYVRKSVVDYLDLFINYKLKVTEAQKNGLDTTEAFLQEFATYEEQLAQPYFVNQKFIDSLTLEAYQRLKEEINVSHILINVREEANPEDTLKAYQKIQEIRKKALSGDDFAQLAQTQSQDLSAKENKGNLGYFTALQFVYPFESTAYKTPVGAISDVVRSQFGYHIIKVHDRRPATGSISVAHIMIQASSKSTEDEQKVAKQKIDEIYSKIQKGENWDKLCAQYSDDATKNQGGVLPEFKVGEVLPEFEQAAQALKKSGDISQPVRTDFGWHIIKLIQKKTLPYFSEVEPALKQDVSKDARAKLSKQDLIKQLQKQNNFLEYPLVISEALSLSDNRLPQASLSYDANKPANAKVLFSLLDKTLKAKKEYKIRDFLEYVYQKQVPKQGLTDPRYTMYLYYQKFKEEMTLAFERNNLARKKPEYKLLLNEYREGIMTFELMNQKIWQKAIDDTLGCKAYFQKNKQNYRWDYRANATIYQLANETLLNQLKNYLSKPLYPVYHLKTDNLYFDKDNFSLDERATTIINDLANILKKNPDLSVELVGHADPAEKKIFAFQRIDATLRYLKFKGINESRIITKDFGISKPVSKDDRGKNRRVEFNLFSNSKKQLEKLLNEENPLNMKMTEGVFQKGENELMDKAQWKPGTQQFSYKDQIIYLEINDIKEPRLKEFDEARGYAITDYQKFLEQEWLKELKGKYPVQINQEEVDKLIKK